MNVRAENITLLADPRTPSFAGHRGGAQNAVIAGGQQSAFSCSLGVNFTEELIFWGV